VSGERFPLVPEHQGERPGSQGLPSP
jgi:hypothetical protein